MLGMVEVSSFHRIRLLVRLAFEDYYIIVFPYYASSAQLGMPPHRNYILFQQYKITFPPFK
jgi:hypothetical protein